MTGLITHMGANRARAERQGLSEEANTGSWAPALSSFLAPSALEAPSQLPMAVRGSNEITQGVEEVSQCCETLSGLLSCSPSGSSLPGHMDIFPQETVRPRHRALSRSRNVVVSGVGRMEAFERGSQTRLRRPYWLLALLFSSMCPSETC